MSMSLDGKHRFVYNLRYGVNGVTSVGAGMDRRTHWGGRCTSLRFDLLTVPLDMPSIWYTEELSYVSRLVLVMEPFTGLRVEEFATYRLDYVAFQRLLNQYHLLKIFDYWLKRVSERYLRLKPTSKLLVDWHCSEVFDRRPVKRRDLCVKVVEWWEYFEYTCLLYASPLSVFAYCFKLFVSADHKNLLFRVAVAEHVAFGLR